ncbi:MAG: citrate/2-methylcitrate synthase [Lachnospiraceae bacterium]|nr:citrate/2-methylcitrate synthase [Lachnospiraceae bacterium]
MEKLGLDPVELSQLTQLCLDNSSIPKDFYDELEVYRGLRDRYGKGVRSGLTKISSVDAFKEVDGKRVPIDGVLCYRGINVEDLVGGFIQDDRLGFEETAYLLLFGRLPDEQELDDFRSLLVRSRNLPRNFTREVIMKAPNRDLMNCLARSVLTLGSYDDAMNDVSIGNVLSQCLTLISVLPMMAVYSYHAYNHYIRGKSFYIHNPRRSLSTAENILRMLRPDKSYTKFEAQVLDLALILHMEHGGGNNSTFTTHVVTSSGTDTYSTMAAALCSLKGPKHGGANIKVMEMMDDIRHHVTDVTDEEALAAYIRKIVAKEAYDRTGLVYGIGHAVYSLSDPRARVFKGFVERLAKEKGREKEFAMYNAVAKLTPGILAENRQMYKAVCANVDFYSGFVYSLLGIPVELYTPMFAIARMVGWSAHRIEELINVDKIIRPAYVAVGTEQPYIPMDER